MYSDLDSLTLALFGEIRASLPPGERWSELRQKIGGLGQAISPLGKLTGLAGLDSSELLSHLAERVGGDTSATAAKRTAEEALRRADRPVLVVMDDLDRLTPEELLVVFKLVRLVGRLPNVYYMISFDEQTLLDVLKGSNLVGNSDRRAREFLEKIVQVRLDLPAFRDRDILVMAHRSLNVLLDAHNLTMKPDEQRRFYEGYFRHMQDRLRTPRAIKRYFGQADATLGPLAGEVDLADFLFVTFLRTSEPAVYRLLGRHHAELTGTHVRPAAWRDIRPNQRAEQWRSRMREAGVAEEHLEGCLDLLAMMFLPVRQALGNGRPSHAALPRLGIGNAEYFDRYVFFGIADDGLPEAVFDRGLTQLAAGGPITGDAAELLLRLREDTQRITRRLQHRRVDGRPVPAAALLQAMADHYGQLTAEPQMMDLLTSEMSARFLARDLLTDLPADDRPQVLAGMASTPGGALLASHTLHRVTSGRFGVSEQLREREWVSEAQVALAERIALHLTQAAAHGAEDLTEPESALIWAWRHTHPESARAWLHQRLDDRWEILPLLAALISPATLQAPFLSDDIVSALDALFGLDELYTRLDPLLDPEAAVTADHHQANLLQALRNH